MRPAQVKDLQTQPLRQGLQKPIEVTTEERLIHRVRVVGNVHKAHHIFIVNRSANLHTEQN